MKWSRDLEDLASELKQTSDNLCNFAYGFTKQQIPASVVEDMIFSSCNHIERIAEDMKRLDAEVTELRSKYVTDEQREEDERAYFESFGYTLVGEGKNAELVDLAEL